MRPEPAVIDTGGTYISIHAPRVGMRQIKTWLYNSILEISIHAPRVGMRLRQLVFLSFQNQHIDFTAILKSHFNTFLSVFKGFTYRKCATLPGISCSLEVRAKFFSCL